MVTVYTKPACQQCNATYRSLDKKGIAYTSVDLTQDLEAYERFKAEGFGSAPIVVAPTGTWSNFRPDLIEELHAFLNPVEDSAE